MPVSGGYKVRVAPLSKWETGTPAPVKKEESDSLTWLSIGLTIAEVGAMLIPGVGPVISTGIAAAFGTAQTVIEYQQTGTVSPTSIGINVASLFLPGIGHGIGTAIKSIRVTKAAAMWEAEIGNRLFARGADFLDKAGEDLEMMNDMKSVLEKAVELQSKEGVIGEAARQTLRESTAKGAFESATTTAERLKLIAEPYGKPLNAFDAWVAGSKDMGINAEYMAKIAQKYEKIAKGGVTSGQVGREAEKDLSLSSKIETEIIEKFGVLDAQELFGSIAKAETTAERTAMIEGFLVERLTTEEAWAFADRIRSLGTRAEFRAGADDIGRTAVKAAKRAARAVNKQAFREANAVQRFNYIMRKIGSARFNDKVVQVVQLMDPSDAGRFFTERLYRRLVKYFKPLFSILGKANKIDTAFKKAGGTLVNSRVIVGYRVIGANKATPANTDIMISFYPESTKSKRATNSKGKANKNFHGKEPVFVSATDMQLEGLVQGGMRYYQKTWALSKGGTAQALTSMQGMGTALMLILPFMNTGLLRNILSLGSNISKMSSKFARGEGANWGEEFIKSLRRSLVNRPGRLLARGVLAPLGRRLGRFAGLVISRESQRFIGIATTAANAALEGKKPRSLYLTMRAQMKSMVNSYGNRAIRSQGGWNAVTQQKKYKRKINMIKRLPRAMSGVKLF